MLYRDSWVEVDLDALRYNVSYIKNKRKKKLIAVIKANGYGCGDAMVAKTVEEAGADMLAVSSLEEALSLREEGIKKDILILGYVNPALADVLKKYDLCTTVVSKQWAEALIKQNCSGCRVHLKADTGMNRIGIKDVSELKDTLKLLVEHQVIVEGLFTHLACAEEVGNEENNLQLERFKRLQEALGYSFKWVHISNSDAAMHFDEENGNAVRCGLAMYGISSFDHKLKPVMALKSRIVYCKKVNRGEKIGYSWSYQTKEDEWIATIPIGYADGWWRKNQGRKAYVNGEVCEFVGRICMDQCMLKVPEGTKTGDIVELFGKNVPVTQVAIELDTIPYEVMTALTDRLTRVYLENDKQVKTVNSRFALFENQ